MTNPMRVALEDARKAIASLHSWALGFSDVVVRPYKDELLAMIDTALASPEGRGEQAWAEPCFTWAGPRGDAPCNTCGHERLQHSQAIEPYADAPGKEHPDVARFRRELAVTLREATIWANNGMCMIDIFDRLADRFSKVTE